MGDHEILSPGAAPIHKQHLEAGDDMDFICPGEPYPTCMAPCDGPGTLMCAKGAWAL